MSPRPKLSESRRQDILAAATSALSERGLCDTRIADIADNIGASPALILYYFPSKAVLLTEALVYQDRMFQESVSEALESAGSARRKLEVLVDACCPREIGDGADSGWTLWPAAWELSRHDPVMAEARAALDEAWRAQISAIVEEGMANGEFHPLDAGTFSIQLAAMLDGLAVEVMLGDPIVDADRMRNVALGFLDLTLKAPV